VGSKVGIDIDGTFVGLEVDGDEVGMDPGEMEGLFVDDVLYAHNTFK